MVSTQLRSLLSRPRSIPARRLPARQLARGLGDGPFIGRGAFFMNTILPAGLVVFCLWGAWRLGKYAITGRREPEPGVPPAWRAVG